MGWLQRQFELARGGGDGNIAAMEGLRGAAVGLVFLAHYAILGGPWLERGLADGLGTLVDRGGRVGVDLFFILSGFLIYGALLRRARPYGPYVWRRLVRIYPTFAAVYVLYVLLSVLVPEQSKIPGDTAAAARLLIANALLLPGLFDVRPINSVTWTLSYEMAFYLAIPLLVTGFGLRRRSVNWRVGCAFAVIALVLVLRAPTELVMFPIGMVVYEAVQARRRVGAGAALVAVAVALVAATLDPQGDWRELRFVVIGVALGVFAVEALGRAEGRLARWLSWTPLRWYGNMSYSYYLIHGLALNGLFWLLGFYRAPQADLGLAVALLALPLVFAYTLIPGALLYVAIERPLSLRRHPEKPAT